MEIRRDDPTAAYVADLLEHHLRELHSVMSEYAFALDSSGLAADDVTFWTAWNDGDPGVESVELLGFVALKELDPTHGELKSMRAAPASVGMGVGRAMLHHVIDEARTRGYERLSLETGTAPLHVPAVSLYRSAGFTACDPFADYQPSPHNQFMSLELT